MTPGRAALLYLALGALYAGALLADMKRDRVPVMRFIVWYQAVQVVAFWPLVGAGHGIALIRFRWKRKRK